MTEPSAPASPAPPPAVDSLTPEQATAEIAETRKNPNHDWAREGRPGHRDAAERMQQLYQRVHGGAAPVAGAGGPPVSDLQRRIQELYVVPETPAAPTTTEAEAFADPADGPRTAADLNAMPPPAFTPEAAKAGWRWDEPQRQAVNATAEAEGLVPLVLDGQHVITQIAADGPVDLVANENAIIRHWGPRFHAKMDAVDRFEALLREKHPAVLAALERTGQSEHRLWLEFAAQAGEAMMDASTPGGERRLKAKYAKFVESAARAGGR
jgi:hypothetical protein